ncbi:hypothetical protein [Mesorhizobium sp. CO1-1-8]|uniref:hypothetical protein n=1 Tax=Mesorhizobium sp. CO1-1-8 TaxID=2876631 RepID=UPI001CD122E1|nr:hypothetical protein [Mesorhizobium sp. CO1-1-8]MBZ9770997.1 hypothetical protein [Mesorhizobium sp. CO1-1-8]
MTYETLKGSIDRPPTIETLFENNIVKIDRITVRGQITPAGVFPDEPSNEFVQLIQGHMVLEYQTADGENKKMSLRAGDYAMKAPTERTRADFTSPDEDTVYLKISHTGGERGKYKLFTGSVGRDEVHGSKNKK